jgi:hypothetical protein
MKKISLKGVKTKQFASLIKRSASMDNLIFVTLNGSKFESTAYNRNKSALKSVSADIETMCDEFTNPFDEPVKIQFSNATKLITTLTLVGEDTVDMVFDIEDNNYAKKLTVKNSEMNVTVNCADKEAVDFLEIPETARFSIFEDTSKLQCSVSITDTEFKKLRGLFGLNKDSVRVFFNLVNGDSIVVSEIESTDENVRSTVNDLIQDNDFVGFQKFDKLYDKKLIHNEFTASEGVENYLGCFNKQYFEWIDSDKFYNIEFHSNKIKFVSFDDDNVKTYVVLTPVRFA